MAISQTILMAATSPALPDPPEEQLPPPVYEVEEEPIERRITTVPVPKDRRGGREPAPAPEGGSPGR